MGCTPNTAIRARGVIFGHDAVRQQTNNEGIHHDIKHNIKSAD